MGFKSAQVHWLSATVNMLNKSNQHFKTILKLLNLNVGTGISSTPFSSAPTVCFGIWRWHSPTAEVMTHLLHLQTTCEGVSKSFRTGRLERELRMVQLSATKCSCMVILWISLVTFSAITLWVTPQRLFIFVSVYFVIDSVRELLNTPSYIGQGNIKKREHPYPEWVKV
jgi:hypothetical protein